jgi:PPOX class probable F420-dependent enzyme
MAVQIGERLRAFLNEKMPVVLSTTRRDGSVQSVPVWYEYADGSILVNGGPTRDWLRHMQRDGRVTLLFVDPNNMFRWAQVQGRLADVREDPGGDHINHLSHRYLDRDYPGPRTDRVKIQIEPTRVTGGDGASNHRQLWDVE